jgi:hypothetical protein
MAQARRRHTQPHRLRRELQGPTLGSPVLRSDFRFGSPHLARAPRPSPRHEVAGNTKIRPDERLHGKSSGLGWGSNDAESCACGERGETAGEYGPASGKATIAFDTKETQTGGEPEPSAGPVDPPKPFSREADGLSTCRPSALHSSRVRRSLPKYPSYKVLRGPADFLRSLSKTANWHCLPVKLPVGQSPWGRGTAALNERS